MPEQPSLGRAAASLTAWNLLSRITGFARVVVTGAALGIGALGDVYQRSNLTSNILFELLVGGVLSAVLVPAFVAHLRQGRAGPARALAEVILGRVGAGLAVVTALGIATAPWIMRGLSAGVDSPSYEAQVELGTFLLWFFMPQLVLYGAGAVATGLLQAQHRFTAAALAPVANNLVAIAIMGAFAVVHGDGSLSLTVGEKVLLGGGTLAGTIAMTAVPLIDLARRGTPLRPRWSHPEVGDLRPLARSGLWGAGHVGLNQVLVAATVVFAGAVDGGVIAYQIAFAFFLLPHAVLAHPIFTALYPRLATHADEGASARVADDVTLGLRSMLLLLVPAAVLLATTAGPLLDVVQVGAVDDRGSGLVALVLEGYALGLVGYSAFFLLTRAAYALGDARSPTLVNLAVTLAAVAGMAAAVALGEGDRTLVGLGVAHGVAVTGGSLALGLVVRRRLGVPLPLGSTAWRAAVAGAAAAVASIAVVLLLDPEGRTSALVAVGCAGTAGLTAYLGALLVLRTPEAMGAIDRLRRRSAAP